MILGLAYAVAIFCALVVVFELINCTILKSEYEVYWTQCFGWACVFAAGGSAIGYIIKGAL